MSENKEVTEFVFDKLEGYMDAAKSVIDTYGGDAAELGLFALRVEAASTLILPLMFLVFIIIYAAKYLPSYYKWGKDRDDEFDLLLGFGVPNLLIIGISIVSIIKLTSIWAWVGMFYPEAYAVHLFLLK